MVGALLYLLNCTVRYVHVSSMLYCTAVHSCTVTVKYDMQKWFPATSPSLQSHTHLHHTCSYFLYIFDDTHPTKKYLFIHTTTTIAIPGGNKIHHDEISQDCIYFSNLYSNVWSSSSSSLVFFLRLFPCCHHYDKNNITLSKNSSCGQLDKSLHGWTRWWPSK